MLSLLKKLFGIRAAEKTVAQAPYKIEAPAVVVEAKPAAKPAKIKAEKKPAAKKTASKKAPAKKPAKATKKSA